MNIDVYLNGRLMRAGDDYRVDETLLFRKTLFKLGLDEACVNTVDFNFDIYKDDVIVFEQDDK